MSYTPLTMGEATQMFLAAARRSLGLIVALLVVLMGCFGAAGWYLHQAVYGP